MKEKNNTCTRRQFTKRTATALGGIPLLNFDSALSRSNKTRNDEINISIFSKQLQFLNYNEMAAAAAEIGFNGIDLTVRPKGHILPERVTDDLPAAVLAMQKYGLAPKMMTTNVWNTNDIVQQTVLNTASELHFTHYRTGWLKYPENKSITESQQLYGQQANELEILNKNLDLIGCYQNHAGNHVGAPIWDLPPILDATKNENIGCQYDIRHAVLEGGNSWELGLRRIKPYIKSLVIKDFKWGLVDGKWKPVNVPLGEGMVDFKRYFRLLKKYKINVPISLHLEYDLGGAEHGATNLSISEKEVFAHMKKDLVYLRETWQNAI